MSSSYQFKSALCFLPFLPQDLQKQLDDQVETVHYAKTEEAASLPDDVWSKTDCIFATSKLPECLSSLDKCPNLRFIQVISAGVDGVLKSHKNFFADPKVQQQVTLCSMNGIHFAIPQYALSNIVNIFQDTMYYAKAQIEQKKWVPARGHMNITELGTQTVGLLGYGSINRETARLAKAYGCKIIAATSDGQKKPDEVGELIVPGAGDKDGSIPEKYYSTRDDASFNDFLSQTDVLIMAVPNIPATYHIMNASRLAKLRKGAVVCNVGRGPQLETDALCEALDNGHLFGAALDVTEPEPLPDNHPLWSKDRVIITPHISGNTSLYLQRSVHVFLLNISRQREGKSWVNKVDIEKGY